MSPEGKQASTSERRRERERAEKTALIVDATRELCLREGYEAVTMRKIAEAIEYSPAAIYQYFKNKEALVSEIIRKDAEEFRRFMLEGFTQEDSVARLIELGRRYVTWGKAHPKQYLLLMSPPSGWIEETWKAYRNEGLMEREVLVILNQAVSEAIESDQFKDEYTDPAPIVATLRAGFHGFVLLENAAVSEETAQLAGLKSAFETRVNMLIHLFLQGLLKNPNEVAAKLDVPKEQ